jgi:hypothetical protein
MSYLLILDHRWTDKTRWTWCPYSALFLYFVKNAKKCNDCHFFVLVFYLVLKVYISSDYVCSCRRTVCSLCVVTGYCRLWNLTDIAVPDWFWTVFVPSMILPWIEWVLLYAAFLVSWRHQVILRSVYIKQLQKLKYMYIHVIDCNI